MEDIKWCSNRGVVINHRSTKDILFAKKVNQENLFINHILLVGKQYMYNSVVDARKQTLVYGFSWQDAITFIN